MKDTNTIEAIIRHADEKTVDLTEKNEADSLKELDLIKRGLRSNKYMESRYGWSLENHLLQLMIDNKIPSRYEIEFRGEFISFIRSFKEKVLGNDVPPRPVREYQPREGIIEYIKAPDGLGPWLEAGVLTRPLLRELSPNGYNALAYWLRDKSNSLEAEGLNIPTKSEVVAQRQSDPLVLREAWRVARGRTRTNARKRDHRRHLEPT